MRNDINLNVSEVYILLPGVRLALGGSQCERPECDCVPIVTPPSPLRLGLNTPARQSRALNGLWGLTTFMSHWTAASLIYFISPRSWYSGMSEPCHEHFLLWDRCHIGSAQIFLRQTFVGVVINKVTWTNVVVDIKNGIRIMFYIWCSRTTIYQQMLMFIVSDSEN